ncbi:MAG: sugar transferase [Pseudomonadota bacterium]
MATLPSHRNGHHSQSVQFHRLQILLDGAYLFSSLFLAGSISVHNGFALSATTAAVLAPIVLWAALLHHRASSAYVMPAKFPAIVWIVVKAVVLGLLSAISLFALANSIMALRFGPWLATAMNGGILAFEFPYLYRMSPRMTDGHRGARKLLIVGSADRAAAFITHLGRSRLPVEVSGIVGRNPKRVGKSILGIPILGLVNDLPNLLRSVHVDEVVFLLSRTWLDLVEKPMLVCERAGLRVLLSTDVYPFRLSNPRIEEVGDFRLLAFEPAGHSELALSIKAVMDFILAMSLVLLTLPLTALVAVAVKLTSCGPIFFKQVRCGLNGRNFLMWKFRTMVADAEQMKSDLAALNEMNGPVFKIRNDPRITGLGRFLRCSSIDELPQLINVLRGEMSLVGPRPPLPEEVAQYDSWQRRRLSVKPGLTCIWQTSGRNQVNFEDWVRMDIEYIDNWSLGLDLRLLLKTIPAVLMGTGE